MSEVLDILGIPLQGHFGVPHFHHSVMAKKLLVADDSLTIQKVIKLALSGDGYEIQTVSDGTECLQQAALFRPDVILIDIGLPGRSAFDIKKAANADPELARVPFVLMSSAFEKVDEAKVGLLRFDGRLTKPFDPSNLKDVLTQALKMNAGHGAKDFSPSPPPRMATPPGAPARKSQGNEITSEIQVPRPGFSPSPFAIGNDDEPSQSSDDSLWNDSPGPQPFDLELQPSRDDSESDNDIRHLTESTVKMSGNLDDLGSWNISENSKSSLPPIPEIFTGDLTQQKDYTALRNSEPSRGSGLDLEFAPPPLSLLDPDFNSDSNSVPISPALAPSLSQSRAQSTMNALDMKSVIENQVNEQLEAVVKTAVQEMVQNLLQGAVKTQLEQMAKKALPEVAERVVKQEIRKILEGLSES